MSANTFQTLLTWFIGADETPHLLSDIWNRPSVRDVLRTVSVGCFSFSDTSRHKHRSIFLGIQQVTKTERYWCRLVSSNEKHPLSIVQPPLCIQVTAALLGTPASRNADLSFTYAWFPRRMTHRIFLRSARDFLWFVWNFLQFHLRFSVIPASR